jgi:hypothetical protein
MATKTWIGGASPVSQVSTYVFANTWETDDLVRAVIGQKKYDFTTGSATIATFLATLVTNWTALNSSTYPEFAEATPTSNGTTLTLTGATAGKPFIATLTPLESDGSASGTGTIEGGTSATTGTTVTAATGPNHWSNDRNWVEGAAPTTSDNVYFSASSSTQASDCLYDISQPSLTLGLLAIEKGYSGKIGLAEHTGTYPEYRTKDLTLASCPSVKIGDGIGQGSQRIRLNVGTGNCTLDVNDTTSSDTPTQETVLFRGTGTNTINISKGSLGVAVRPGELANVSTLRVGYKSSVLGDSNVRSGAGTTLSTVIQSGGTFEANSSIPTLTKSDGSLGFNGTGTIGPSWANTGGSIFYRSSGTLSPGTNGGTLDFRQDPRSRTVQTLTLVAGAILQDPAETVTYSGAMTLSNCSPEDVTLNIGDGKSFVIS